MYPLFVVLYSACVGIVVHFEMYPLAVFGFMVYLGMLDDKWLR